MNAAFLGTISHSPAHTPELYDLNTDDVYEFGDVVARSPLYGRMGVICGNRMSAQQLSSTAKQNLVAGVRPNIRLSQRRKIELRHFNAK
jgi:hypothetical protein